MGPVPLNRSIRHKNTAEKPRRKTPRQARSSDKTPYSCPVSTGSHSLTVNPRPCGPGRAFGFVVTTVAAPVLGRREVQLTRCLALVLG